MPPLPDSTTIITKASAPASSIATTATATSAVSTAGEAANTAISPSTAGSSLALGSTIASSTGGWWNSIASRCTSFASSIANSEFITQCTANPKTALALGLVGAGAAAGAYWCFRPTSTVPTRYDELSAKYSAGPWGSVKSSTDYEALSDVDRKRYGVYMMEGAQGVMMSAVSRLTETVDPRLMSHDEDKAVEGIVKGTFASVEQKPWEGVRIVAEGSDKVDSVAAKVEKRLYARGG